MGRRLLCGLLLLPLTAVAAPGAARYEIQPNTDLRSLNVRACFPDGLPGELQATASQAASALRDPRLEPDLTPPQVDGPVLRLPPAAQPGCLRYRVELADDGAPALYSGGVTRRYGPDLLTELGLWLWRPRGDGPLDLVFQLPPGMTVSTPWPPPDPALGAPTYRIGGGEAVSRPASVAFGRFREARLEVPGGRLRLALLGGLDPARQDKLTRWLNDAALSVAAIYGRFPVADAQVLVLPGARGQEPVPNAYVLRGGAGAPHFLVNARRPLQVFVDDWSAAHELAHLFLPVVASADAWLPEGLATYYQHLARARSGAVSAEETWRRMHVAFLQARTLAAASPATLAEASRRMPREGQYMRVYNGGAAVLLLADVALRERSGGRQSLDSVLERFGACCLDPTVEWTAQQVLARFDAIAGGDLFSSLYDQYVEATGFPDLEPLYRRLGLQVLGARVRLQDTAPLVAVRDAILAPGPYRTPATLLDR